MKDIEVDEINKQLEIMMENYITIILQPCEKHREETQVKGVFRKKKITLLNTFHSTKLRMKPFTLSKCMRNSIRINHLVKSAQDVLTSEPCVYFKPKETGEYLVQDMLHTKLKGTNDKKVIDSEDGTHIEL